MITFLELRYIVLETLQYQCLMRYAEVCMKDQLIADELYRVLTLIGADLKSAKQALELFASKGDAK